MADQKKIKQLEEKVKALEKSLSAKEKICEILTKRVERSIDSVGGAYSIFERNILLQNLVDQRSRELGDANKKLSQEINKRIKSEQRLHSVIQGSPIPTFVIGKDHRVVYWNKALEELSGIRAEEVIGTTQQWRAFYKEERPCMADLLVDELLAAIPQWYSDKYIKSTLIEGAHEATDFFPELGNGGKWLRFTAASIRDSQGDLVGAIETLEDITERKQAEEALRFTQFAIDKTIDQAFWMTEDARFFYVNEAACRTLGYSREELLKLSVPDIGPTFPSEVFAEHWRDLQENGSATFESFHRTKDGRVYPVEIRANYVVFDGKEYNCAFATDITERKRTEEERERLATAIEQTAEGIIITDPHWIIHYINPAFERMTGYSRSDIIGQHTRILKSDKHDKGFYKNIRDTLTEGKIWSGRANNKRKDGTFYEVEVTASPIRDSSCKIINYVSIHRDITGEIRLERQLRQAHKMQAIGTLAGGIAHDFNNILTAIIGFTDMALYKVPGGTPVRNYLEQVLKAGSRARDMVSQILTFSRQTEQERKPVQIAHAVDEALRLMRSSLPSTIEILHDIAIPPEKGIVLADTTQIHQVLMNLCTNAAHAMRATGGIVSVSLSEVEVDSNFVLHHPELKPGPYVRLTISDTGHGMDTATMERIFDPYFTTKDTSEGTGLGLAVVQGIVKSYGGAITVYSEPGQGTTFHVFLPRIEEKILPESAAESVIPGGSERILFIDDEKALVTLGKEMLESLGYSVVIQTSSIEALETFRKQPDAFDLVITDMTMPKVTGIALAKELMNIRSDMPIILCTGFSELINGKQSKEAGIREFVMKPFSLQSLAKIIRQVLDKK